MTTARSFFKFYHMGVSIQGLGLASAIASAVKRELDQKCSSQDTNLHPYEMLAPNVED